MSFHHHDGGVGVVGVNGDIDEQDSMDIDITMIVKELSALAGGFFYLLLVIP